MAHRQVAVDEGRAPQDPDEGRPLPRPRGGRAGTRGPAGAGARLALRHRVRRRRMTFEPRLQVTLGITGALTVHRITLGSGPLRLDAFETAPLPGFWAFTGVSEEKNSQRWVFM